MQEKDACGSDDHLIHYLELFYCLAGGRIWPLVAVAFVVWMLLLFYGMSIVAEVFLCPAVEVGFKPCHLASGIWWLCSHTISSHVVSPWLGISC